MAIIPCAVVVSLFNSSSIAVAANGSPIYATPAYAPLKGLKKLKLEVKVTRDVKNELAHIGAPSPFVDEGLSTVAKEKLKEAGIEFEGSDNGPVLHVLVDTDLSTDEFTVTVRLSDKISLVRQPAAQFSCNLWQASGHPSSDESGPLKEALRGILDKFIGDYLEANPRVQ
jgi:hypothetical protein